MAHFAKIDENNLVLAVSTLDDKDMLDENGVPQESIGQQYLQTHNNWPAHLWIQTSYNTYNNQHRNGGTPLRGNYAGIGYTYDSTNNIFICPKPYPSWTLDVQTADWISPVGGAPELTEEQLSQNQSGSHLWDYDWNEDTQSWDLKDRFA